MRWIWLGALVHDQGLFAWMFFLAVLVLLAVAYEAGQ